MIKKPKKNPVMIDKEIQVDIKNDVKEQESQTIEEEICICKEECNVSKVQYNKDKVICILKRAICSEEEWQDYEDKVQSEMDIEELLEDLGKVLEATDRLTRRENSC